MRAAEIGPADAARTLLVADDASTAPADWDERAVRAPGGHVMQSATWAEYRRSGGIEPRFLTFSDGRVALASLRRSPLLPGVEAAVRRGPAHASDDVGLCVARMVAITSWARQQGARDLFMDPERDHDPAWEAAVEAAGFRIAEERDPSIHVMRLDLAAGASPETVWSGLSRSTRQRIRAAEASSTTVRDDRTGQRLLDFAELLRDRAGDLGIPLQAGTGYVRGWRLLLEAGLARLLVAEHEAELVGGLVVYLHAGIHATAYSADQAKRRSDLPGTMHLLRWMAIREALEAGAAAIELGGVDLPGRREPPRRGEPNFGLYEHKRSFGARWVRRSPARRVVLRAWVESVARVRRRAIDASRRVRR